MKATLHCPSTFSGHDPAITDSCWDMHAPTVVEMRYAAPNSLEDRCMQYGTMIFSLCRESNSGRVAAYLEKGVVVLHFHQLSTQLKQPLNSFDDDDEDLFVNYNSTYFFATLPFLQLA